MKKVTIANKTIVYPMPAFLIGADIDGKPNFMTAAWSGIGGSEPPVITVGIRHSRYTMKGIQQNMTLSVNVPSVELVKETDYCGIESGSKTDKVKTCGFTVFRGKLVTAPMIEECPVNLECQVMHLLDVGSHILVVAEIKEAYITESCLSEGKPDVTKINSFAFNPGPGSDYQAFGEIVGKAFKTGLDMKP